MHGRIYTHSLWPSWSNEILLKKLAVLPLPLVMINRSVLPNTVGTKFTPMFFSHFAQQITCFPPFDIKGVKTGWKEVFSKQPLNYFCRKGEKSLGVRWMAGETCVVTQFVKRSLYKINLKEVQGFFSHRVLHLRTREWERKSSNFFRGKAFFYFLFVINSIVLEMPRLRMNGDLAWMITWWKG